MAEVSHKDHRKRLREEYLKNPDSVMSDRAILELFLTYAIPRKDVKPYAYSLLNEYGTLSNVFKADINELMNINGLGESTAILFNLFSKINKAIEAENQLNLKTINSTEKAAEYIKKEIGNLNHEKFVIITLDEKSKVINLHPISDGLQNSVTIDKQKLIRKVLNDNASNVILAHNHPTGILEPSIDDIATTVDILGFLRELNVHLLDHIIVTSEETFCMSTSLEYSRYFD